MRMKKFTFMLIAALMAVISYSQAATPVKRVLLGQQLPAKVEAPVAMNAKQANFGLKKQVQTRARAQKRAVAAANLEGTYLWEYKTANERAVDPDTIETESGSVYVTIAAASDSTVTISGMFDSDLTAVVKDSVLIINRQKAGTSSYGDYDIAGLFYYPGDEQYEAGWYNGAIYGNINKDGVISFDDYWFIRILTTGSYVGASLTPYWVAGSTLTPSVGPQQVVLPEGVEAADYAMSYKDSDGASATTPVKVAVDGNDVYVQGISNFIPEAWVKGTKDGNQVTFAGNQYLGEYGNNGSSYAFYNGDAVFTYDAEKETYSATGTIFGVLANKYYDGYYTDPVMEKVVEKAATPANPSITSLKNGSYGYYITFNVPLVDTDGNNMLASKLSYEIFTDVEKEVKPLTFTSATHSKLTEDMTIIPFGFSENYDFYDTQIYLNNLYSADWNKLGIKSIYTGGGETNETEIQWFTVKPYAVDSARTALGVEIEKAQTLLADSTYTEGIKELSDAITDAKTVFDNAEATVDQLKAAIAALKDAIVAFIEANTDPTAGEATWVAADQGYANATVITAFNIDSNITATLDKANGTTAPAYYNTGSALRIYGKNTMTIKGGENVKSIDKIEFTFVSANYAGGLKSDPATYTVEGTTGTWVGEADSIFFINDTTSQSRIKQITVYYTKGGGVEPQPEEDVLVTLPEGVEPVEYTLKATGKAYGNSGWQDLNVENTAYVAFNGDDVYVSGLAFFFKDSYVKGKLADGKVTFKSGQFVGEDKYGKEYIIGLAEDETEKTVISDFVFAFDAEARSLTLTEDAFVGESERADSLLLYTYLTEATYTVGGVVLPDVVTLPEGVEVNTWYLSGKNGDGKIYGDEVGVAFDGNDIYVQGLCTYLPEAWVKGTLNGTTATFASGQYYGQYSGQYNLFFVGADVEGEANLDVAFEYDAEAGSLTCDENTIILLGSSATSLFDSSYDYLMNAVITREQPEQPEVVVAPLDLVAEPYLLTAYDKDVTREVKVGFYGENEVYFQGLSEYVEDAWVKGINNNGVISIPETYLGIYESLFGDSELSMNAAEFVYNAEEQKFTSEAGFTTTDGEYAYDELEQVVLTKIVEKAATPADPEIVQFKLITETGEFTKYPSVKFNIPVIDTEGNAMVSDKLSYIVYIVDSLGVEAPLTFTTDLYTKLTEDMTEIPYNFSDTWDIYAGGSPVYLNQEPTLIASWKKIGVQSIYRGMGEEHSSNKVWFDIEDLMSGISSVTANEGEVRYFDLQGRAANGSAKGLLIKQVRDAQGNVKTVKVVRK